jgi:preprotein translocase subunit SecG
MFGSNSANNFPKICGANRGLTLVVAFQVIQIIISLVIIALVLLQAKGSGLGGIFGGDGGIYRTRRGVEKSLYQITIGLSILFFMISLVSVILSR